MGGGDCCDSQGTAGRTKAAFHVKRFKMLQKIAKLKLDLKKNTDGKGEEP